MDSRTLDRLMLSHEEARRLYYVQPTMPVPQSSISGPRDEALTVRLGPMDFGAQHQHQLQQRIRTQRLTKINDGPMVGSSSPVSRRNARERKRVRLVNLGFSTLRERIPAGVKNKKLSKVETLKAAIQHIRNLQQALGIADTQSQNIIFNENFGQDDCSSVASSEEITGFQSSHGPANGSGDLSPASSHPSDCSLVSSPYAPQHSQDEQLMDITAWFS